MGRTTRKGLEQEFKFVKYERATRAQRAPLDANVDKVVVAEGINGVLCCGNNLHLFNPQRRRVEKRVKEGLDGTTVIKCVHIPELRAIFTSTLDCKITQWDDSWFTKKRAWLVDDPQLCFFLPKPLDYRRGESVPPPRIMLTGDTAGNIHEWDLCKDYKGHVEGNNRKVHDDWVTDMLVPNHSQHILVTCSLDCTVKLWERKTFFGKDAATGDFQTQPFRVIRAHDRPLTGLLDLPHLDLVASWGQNHHISVWSPTTDEVMQRLDGHGRPVVRVMQGAHVHELISVDRGGVACVWDCRMFNMLQMCEDKAIIEDDHVTDACYDVHTETIITTRKHIREVSLNFRGRRPAAEADASSTAGPITKLLYCPHTENLVMVAGVEASLWRGRDGCPEAVLTGLNGVFYPFEPEHPPRAEPETDVDLSDGCQEITCAIVDEVAGDDVNGEPAGLVYFGCETGDMAVHETNEGRRIYTMEIFREDRLLAIDRLRGSYQGAKRPFVVACESGKTALFVTTSVVDGFGIKAVLLMWRCPSNSYLPGVLFDRSLQYLVGAGKDTDTVYVWNLDSAPSKRRGALRHAPIEQPIAALTVGPSLHAISAKIEEESALNMGNEETVDLDMDGKRSLSPDPSIDGAGGKSFGFAVTAWCFVGGHTDGGGTTLALASLETNSEPSAGDSSNKTAEPGSESANPDVNTADAGSSQPELEPLPTLEVGWLVCADSSHWITVWRIDSWEPLFCWSTLSSASRGLGRHPVTNLAGLGKLANPGQGGYKLLFDVDCVLAADDESPGKVILWDVDALCLRWRAAVAQGQFKDQPTPHRLELEQPGGATLSDVVIRRVPLQASSTFVTTLAKLPHPLAYQSNIEAADVPAAYILCGADDGKAKIYDPLADQLAGQLMPDGDDDWAFLQNVPAPHDPSLSRAQAAGEEEGVVLSLPAIGGSGATGTTSGTGKISPARRRRMKPRQSVSKAISTAQAKRQAAKQEMGKPKAANKDALARLHRQDYIKAHGDRALRSREAQRRAAERAARQEAEAASGRLALRRELNGASPFFSLMMESADRTKVVKPWFLEKHTVTDYSDMPPTDAFLVVPDRRNPNKSRIVRSPSPPPPLSTSIHGGPHQRRNAIEEALESPNSMKNSYT
eukprot:SAG31_NODE_214_length_20084_cov_2.644684_13_plen_1136_part_00